MDRRQALQWVVAAAGYIGSRGSGAFGAGATRVRGYGTDPDLTKACQPGDLWPLTFTPTQHAIATQLCDTIIPADGHSPSASSVGVVEFIDEWLSAPYPGHADDRDRVLEGFAWLEQESERRFARGFQQLDAGQVAAICDDICNAVAAKEEFRAAAHFFARFRDLTAGGFYTTSAGRNDLNYVGNVPLAAFEGPPLEVLKAAGLA
jgi:hypothetical protein